MAPEDEEFPEDNFPDDGDLEPYDKTQGEHLDDSDPQSHIEKQSPRFIGDVPPYNYTPDEFGGASDSVKISISSSEKGDNTPSEIIEMFSAEGNKVMGSDTPQDSNPMDSKQNLMSTIGSELPEAVLLPDTILSLSEYISNIEDLVLTTTTHTPVKSLNLPKTKKAYEQSVSQTVVNPHHLESFSQNILSCMKLLVDELKTTRISAEIAENKTLQLERELITTKKILDTLIYSLKGLSK